MDKPQRARHHESMSRRRGQWITAAGVLVILCSILLPAAAARIERDIRAHERLHYGLHLAAGRTLSLCPCTRLLARTQYDKAEAHAQTVRQQLLVTSAIPSGPDERLEDAVLVSRITASVLVRRSHALLPLASMAAVAITLTGAFLLIRQVGQVQGTR